MGVSALAYSCGQLHTIDMSESQGITDMGVSALGRGCGQLHTIDLSCCHGITDIGISELGRGCGQLHTIDLCRRQGITDMDVSAWDTFFSSWNKFNTKIFQNLIFILSPECICLINSFVRGIYVLLLYYHL
jgi:EIN3-binding F-box protein